jgi:3D (Asp-Asp-Asp) domain-containing protein
VWYGPALVGGGRTRSAVRLAGAAAVIVLVASATAAASPHDNAASLRARAHSAVLDLYALDTRMQAAQAHLAALQAQAVSLRSEQITLQLRTTAARRALVVSQRQLSDNLRALYEQGDIEPLAVILGSQSLDDAMSKLDDLTRVADENHQVVRVTAAAKTRLGTLRAQLAARRARLAAALADAQRTADELAAAHAARVSFIAGLRLKADRLDALQAQAQRVEAKSQALQAAAAVAPTPVSETITTPAEPSPAPATLDAPAPASGRTITVDSTGYVIVGRTATGVPTGWGVVAVDPSVIPLGTRLTIPGYGEAVAADTGGAVRGNTIDIWFPSLAQARAWGRRTVTITLH